jgi:ferric-dicitrate binding protein FerR (iron transport regulator)
MRGIYVFFFSVAFVACGGRPETALKDGSTFHLGKGSPQLFRLPDSSTVVLSPETSIAVSKGDVQLDGEGMFEVRGPVVVHTRDLVIEVLWGAKFHVDAYRSKAGEEVDVLGGRLRVHKSYHSDTDNEPETLDSGDMVMINRDIDLMEKEKLTPAELDKLKGKQ